MGSGSIEDHVQSHEGWFSVRVSEDSAFSLVFLLVSLFNSSVAPHRSMLDDTG